MIANADPVGITGGVPIAVLLMLCMLLGLLPVFLMLIVQLVTLYFTGVLLPLGLVWIIDPSKRAFGMKIVSVWIGILAAHPLLFFLLGFAFTIMANSVATFGNNASLQSLVTLSVAVIALFIAALSPLLPPLQIAMPRDGGAGGNKSLDSRFDLVVNNAAASQVFMGIVSGTRYSMLVHPEVTGAISDQMVVRFLLNRM